MLNTLCKFDYHKEQIQTLLKSKFSAIGGNFLVPIVFFFIYKDVIPMYLLNIWLIAQIVIFITRMRISTNVLNKINTLDKESSNTHLKNYMYTIFVNSFLWGLASILVILYSDEIGLYIFFMIIMGISTAAMSTLSVVFHALFIFVFNIMTISIISFIFLGGEKAHYLLTLFGLFYIIFILSAGFRSFKYMNNNIKQREELQENNNNFKNLLDITMEAIIILDENHIIKDINQSGLHLLNANDKAQIIGQSLIKYLQNYSIPKLHNSMSKKEEKPYELDLKRDNGEHFPALISSKDSTINGEMIRIITILDLTQLKDKDKQLIQQSRLAQMGEMISMIAHQWRQPLSAISATTNNLLLSVMMDNYNKEEFENEIGLIANYSQHLSKTIDDFRGFFKESKELETTTLQEILNSTLDIAKVSIENKNITLNTNFNCTKEIKTYPSEIKQVILNLIKNAQDALLENKTINPTITIQISCKKDNHILTVKDNAGGIPSDIIDKIFKPYFSTKKEKDGTGLGLYMSKTIIEDHCGGKLSVENDSEGAIFTIVLYQIK